MNYTHGYDATGRAADQRPSSSAGYDHAGASQNRYPQNPLPEHPYALAQYGFSEQTRAGYQQAAAMYGQQYDQNLQYQQQYFGQANYAHVYAQAAANVGPSQATYILPQAGVPASSQPMVVIPQRSPSHYGPSSYAQPRSPLPPPTTSHLHYSSSFNQQPSANYMSSPQQPRQQLHSQILHQQRQQQQQTHLDHAQQPSRPQSSAQWQGHAAKKPPTPQSPSVDYQQLLLLLADEYVNAAHGLGSLVAFYRRAEDMKAYYNLMATGLSCVEASLTKFRLSPRAEAELILQYCNLLYRETENYDVIDMWLSKGIPLCERNKFLDLKYAMQHLSARALFQTKPKVAVKSLDALIPQAQAYRHVPWIYSLRFLRVSFAMGMLQAGASQSEFTLAMQNLKAIAELAGEENDGAVSILCATFEALLHLRSMLANCVEEAQRAIAAAKSLQFDTLAKDLNQIWVLLDCLEMMCYLMSGKLDLAASVAQRIASVMDEHGDSPSEADDGLLLVPLRTKPGAMTECTTDDFRRQNVPDHLTYTWLHRRDLWTLCFLFNAIAAEARDYNNIKAETYLRQGMKIMKENFSGYDASNDSILPASASLNAAVERIDWWLNCRWYLHIYAATSLASRSKWTQAQEYLDLAQDCPPVSSMNTASLRRKWETYLQGVILQGTGDLTSAYTTFRSNILALPRSATGKHDLATDLAILATLNSILIALEPSHASDDPTMLHASLAPYLTGHPNKSLHGSFDLLKAVLNPSSKVIDKKKHIQYCIAAARDVNNNQLFAVCFCLMCELFFQGMGSEQAGKSVKTARSMAGRSGMALWRGVAAGLEGGKGSASADAGVDLAGGPDEVQKYLSALPELVRARFVVED